MASERRSDVGRRRPCLTVHNLRSRSRVRDPSKARTPLQGGELIGVRKKTTKKERKNVKKRLKRHK